MELSAFTSTKFRYFRHDFLTYEKGTLLHIQPGPYQSLLLRRKSVNWLSYLLDRIQQVRQALRIESDSTIGHRPLTTIVRPRPNDPRVVGVENPAAGIDAMLIGPSPYIHQTSAAFGQLRFLTRWSPFVNKIVSVFPFPRTHLL